MALLLNGNYYMVARNELSKGFGTICEVRIYKSKVERDLGMHKFIKTKSYHFEGEKTIEEIYTGLKLLKEFETATDV